MSFVDVMMLGALTGLTGLTGLVLLAALLAVPVAFVVAGARKHNL